jgi:hypothetical protein
MNLVRRASPYAVLVVLLIAGGTFWFRHNEILDWAATRGYDPPAVVEIIAGDTAMTPYAERLFYVNRPMVADKQEFNQNCTDPSEQVAVLGCFLGNRMGIYIYDVTDERLAGIEQVTGAHEMLHQAYQRLSSAEKTRIGGLLQEYHDLKASQDLKDKIATYGDGDPYRLQNEMHSIFGTEAPDLPDELEQYYKQYFEDRQKVLALYQKYQAEFDERLAQIEAYDEQLSGLQARINANRQELQTREQELRQRRAQLDAYLAANRVNEYNVAVPGFNAQVAAYRDLINSTNSMIDEFNRILASRNDLAVEERELEGAIDSQIDIKE